MKIVVITGSAHRNGTSAFLAENFIKGAEEAGHEIFRFDAAFKNVHPCIGCEKCHNTEDGCAFADDMNELNPKLLEADMLVFVSPIYYFGMNAQIRTVIDRFYANDGALHAPKKSALLLTCAGTSDETIEGAVATYRATANWLGWKDMGIVAARGCATLDAMKQTDYPKQAYELGGSLQG